MEISVNVSEMPKADEIRNVLKSLPVQAQQYIMGCVDIARLFSSEPEEVKSV